MTGYRFYNTDIEVLADRYEEEMQERAELKEEILEEKKFAKILPEDSDLPF